MARDRILARAGTAGRSPPPPFVGRTLEVESLVRDLEGARSGVASVVLFEGDPGIGKTRLLLEFRARAESRGARCGYGRPYPDVPIPYLPFLDALIPFVERDRPDVGVELRGRLQGSSEPAGARRTRGELFTALSRAAIDAGRVRPTVLLIDDLQWTDEATLQAFAHLAFSIASLGGREDAGLLLVAAARPARAGSALARLRERLRRETSCALLDLAGLDDDASRELVEGLGVGRPSQGLLGALQRTTRGNPLFLLETLAQLRDAQALESREGATALRAADPVELPRDVVTAVRGRLRGLGAATRRVLASAATIGDAFDLERLAIACEATSTKRLLPALERGLRAGILRESASGFDFAHFLVRDALRAEVSRPRRARIHARLAHALIARSPESELEIAHHLDHAGPEVAPALVAHHARRAADRAFAAFAWETAARFYELALRSTPSGDSALRAERAELHYRAGVAHNRNMDSGPAMTHYASAASEWEAVGDGAGLVRALTDRLRSELTFGRVTRGQLADVEPLQRAVESLGEAEPSLRGGALDVLSSAYWAARRPDRAEQLARDALAVARANGDDRLCGELGTSLGLAHLERLRPEEALEAWLTGYEHAVRAGDWPTAGLCQQRVPLALCYLGRLGEARAAVATARELNERIQNWGDFSLVSAAAQILATLEGRFDEAEAHAAETLRLIRRSRYPWAGPISLTALAGGRALRGDFEGARDALRALAVEGRIFDDPSAMRVIVAQLSPLLDALERGAAHVARETPAERTVFAPDSLDLWRVTRVCAAVERAWRLRAPELARGARAALRHAEERGLVVTSGWVFVIPRCLGLAAALDGDLDEARDALDRAIAWAEREGARAELARAYLDRAEVADARGGPGSGDARELRARGEKLCRELGIHPFALAGPATLAPDDRRLLASLARGGSTADAADDLILDEKTYAARLQRLFEKLGAGGPTEAVAAALALEGGSTSLLRALRAATPESAGAPLSVTILVTDLEGSTQLLSEVGDEAARDLLRLHNRIVRSCLQDTGGREIQQTGDGFLAWFDDAARAVRCAQEVQRRVARHARAHPGLALRVRSGLHAGTAFPDEERLVGIAVNVAARICTASAAGEILVSERVRDAASDAAVFTPRGPRALKGLADPIYLFSVGWR